ncbi:Hypothetical predicted protein [Olea europaea subsp. europaea]|uniref:Uncharacterized protein n=1 Tax=Olea europaea subsp. europaea TaxID=158383 RepID=A0A8S0QYG5_OLEEU|nr:Hypothetical predicted protein [Olea europaea subsp. europaea]
MGKLLVRNTGTRGNFGQVMNTECTLPEQEEILVKFMNTECTYEALNLCGIRGDTRKPFGSEETIENERGRRGCELGTCWDGVLLMQINGVLQGQVMSKRMAKPLKKKHAFLEESFKGHIILNPLLRIFIFAKWKFCSRTEELGQS